MEIRTLFVFVDGLGIGPTDPEVNPLHRGHSPFLAELVHHRAVAVDATLDVDGMPQSATGQTTMFTGVNGAKVMGRHKEGLPGPTLKAVIRNDNLFASLRLRGYHPAFANAYFLKGLTPEQMRRRQSVTTVMTLQAVGSVRTEKELDVGEAVYNDLTRHRLRERGYTGPVIEPEQAAADLLRVAGKHDFTLFEFFQTDLVAHKGSAEDAAVVLGRLDRFLREAIRFADEPGCLFVLLSDHGNIEDCRSRSHNRNPVPLVAEGECADRLRSGIRRLEDLAPVLLDLYPFRPGFPAG